MVLRLRCGLCGIHTSALTSRSHSLSEVGSATPACSVASPTASTTRGYPSRISSISGRSEAVGVFPFSQPKTSTRNARFAHHWSTRACRPQRRRCLSAPSPPVVIPLLPILSNALACGSGSNRRTCPLVVMRPMRPPALNQMLLSGPTVRSRGSINLRHHLLPKIVPNLGQPAFSPP